MAEAALILLPSRLGPFVRSGPQEYVPVKDSGRHVDPAKKVSLGTGFHVELQGRVIYNTVHLIVRHSGVTYGKLPEGKR